MSSEMIPLGTPASANQAGAKGTACVEEAVRDRYSDGARQREETLCCPVSFDASLLKIIPEEVLDRDYGCGDPTPYVQPGDTVLDLGCGTAHLAKALLLRGVAYVGLDRNPAMLARAARALDEWGPGRGLVVRGDVAALPFDPSSFDVVVATGVLGLLTVATRHTTLQEMVRVSRGQVRLLEPIGFLRRSRRRGDRREYLSAPPGTFLAFVANAGTIYRRLREIIEEGLEAMSGKPPPLRARLEEAHDFVAVIEREIPATLERFAAALPA